MNDDGRQGRMPAPAGLLAVLAAAIASVIAGAMQRDAAWRPQGFATGATKAAALRQQAREASARGDGDAAMAALRNALEASPRDAGVRRDLGEAHVARGEWDEAARHLSKAAEASPGDTALRIAAAEAEARAGRPLRARTLLEDGVARDGDDAALRTALAEFLREHGDTAAAQANLEAAVRAHPDEAGAWRDLARLHAAAHRAADAAECWSRVLALQPRDAAAMAGLARARRDQGDADAARSLLRRSLEADAQQPAVLLDLARLVATDDPREAAPLYAQLRATNPGSARLAREHALVLAAASRDDEAVAAFSAALALDASDTDSALELSWLLATRPGSTAAEREQALRWARIAATARKDDASALDTLAAAEAASGDFAAAARDAERALSAGSIFHDDEWSAAVERRLRLYREGRAWSRDDGGQKPPPAVANR